MTLAGELCLHEVFQAQAALTPAAIALVSADQQLSYAELDRRSNRLARRMQQLGAGPGQFVALYFDRSELPIIAILACHKSGAAYVPIDPSYPGDRIQHIITELGVTLCLTESALSLRAESLFSGTKFLVLDEIGAELAGLPGTALDREESPVSPEDLAYVIYTSGTTGRPKGVMTEHGHVTRFVAAFNKVCATGPQDRVYQGFSLSFDGSVEEIWMAFSNGSTLVVPARDAPRFGAELGQYLAQQQVSYFSTVPTLLSTVPEPVPSLRTVVLSGEVCPPDLVARWATPQCRILNVYGPTEATVNTTVAECVPGQPVTIGRPLPGYGIHVVDADLRPVPDGTTGELLISGDTLARGYLEQPQLTSQRFLDAPVLDGGGTIRCYRTGDLVRWNEDAELEFFGRMDSQVKIRGYRVELAEIESVLLRHRQVSAATVRLVEQAGLQELAGYVLTDSAEPLERNEILELLESAVPPYMIPGYLDVLPELPRTTSGKIDRNRLPGPVAPLVRSPRVLVPPATGLERAITEVWTATLGVPAVSVEDDFFLDLGGHSLVAARAVTQLRERTGHPVTVRDAYQFPTVRGLAAHLETLDRPDPVGPQAETSPVSNADNRAPRWTRVVTAALQALSLYLVSGLVMIPATLLFLAAIGWAEGTVSTAGVLGLLVGLTLLTWPALLLFSIAAKWLIIGRYRPGDHPLWGFYYWRWWLTGQLVALSGAGALSGTPLLPLYYRLMGARVGARCTLDTVQCSAWDLVSIGSDTSIGASTQILGCRVENGQLRFGRIDIGDRCFVGIHSAIGLDAGMGEESTLDDQSLLPDGGQLPAGQGWAGSPARPATVTLPSGAAPQGRVRRAAFGLAHLLTVSVMGVVLALLPTVLYAGAIYWFFVTGGLVVGIAATVVSVPVEILLYCLYLSGLKRLVGRGIRPGTHPVLSGAYYRKWLSDELMGFTRLVLLPVYTTLYLPPLLRLMGAKIGPRAEISTVWSFAPELIDVGQESFFADGSIVGGRRTHRGQTQIAVNRLGRRSFIGNSAVLPTGKSLGDNCLLGVQSIPPLDTPCVADGTEWLGSPSFALTHRVKVGGFDQTVTFRPTRRLYLQRALIDGLRVLIPYYLLLAAAFGTGYVLLLQYQSSGTAAMIALGPVAGFAAALVAAILVAGLKKAVMGTYKPEIKPLWSKYVWLNEMVNGAYESVAAPVIARLLGTPFAPPLLRMMGCHIGRGAYLGTTLFSEFDLVHIGDRVELNHGVVIQNHLFEDRVFKSSTLRIGDGVSVGNMSVVLYDSEIEDGAVVGPLSLLMKGETLRQHSRWHGIPTLRQDEPATRSAAVRDRTGVGSP